MNTYYKTSEVVEVPNYPYGFNNRTTAFFSLEYKSGKGFRTVKQTINPKTGLKNKPKKSTYSPVILMCDVAGKVKYRHLDFYSDEGKIRDLKFMYENHHLFTPDQIKDIAITLLAILKADIYAKVTYCGSDIKKMLPLYTDAINQVVKIANTGENLFNKVVIDFDAVEKLEVKDYKPFKVTSYQIG